MVLGAARKAVFQAADLLPWVAGVVLRSGRVPIVAQGSREAPLAFFVLYRGHGFLFHRNPDSASGPFPESYCVIALPEECDAETLRRRGFEPPCDSRLLGTVSSRDLRFEHRTGDYVDEETLATTLERLSA